MVARLSRLLLLCAVLGAVVDATAPPLEKYFVDAAKTSVSGISAGAYMAVQYHVANSASVYGAGVIAGGPYYCAQANVEIALGACMSKPAQIDVDYLASVTRTTASTTRTIDPVEHLKNAPVYVFSGTQDSVVHQGVGKKLVKYYEAFSANVTSEFSIASEHAFITASFGNPCNYLGSPYINNCDYDAAYALLTTIYGQMDPSVPSKPENLMYFDQSEFFALSEPTEYGFDFTGSIYVPTDCKSGQVECRLHLAFHGCLMTYSLINDSFTAHAGYNEIAEANHLIILYPQAHSTTLNPKACFDWWGYTGVDYASKIGFQMAALTKMISRVTGV